MSRSTFTVTFEGAEYTFTRKEALAIIWRHTHRDFKGTTGGVRTVLTLRENVTTLVDLGSLTDEEIEYKLAGSIRKEVARRAKKAE